MIQYYKILEPKRNNNYGLNMSWLPKKYQRKDK